MVEDEKSMKAFEMRLYKGIMKIVNKPGNLKKMDNKTTVNGHASDLDSYQS